MPQTNPRIIIVDTRQTLHNIVRAAMELMGRRPRLIETYTGDDAITELKIGSPDLLITAQTLTSTTHGPLLAIMAKRELAALPVIVVGDEDDPELDEETLAESPFQYIRRPFAPESFLRALRVALDGPEAVPQEMRGEEIIPVPPVDIDALLQVMFRLMREIGAMAVVLADRNGKVVTYDGAAGYLDREALAAALAHGFGAVMKLLPVIGDQPRVLKHFEGERGNLFALAVGLHHFMMLFFSGQAPAGALGNVRRFGGAAVNDMLKIMGPVAFDPNPKPVAQPASTKPEPPMPSKRRTKTHTQELKAVPYATPTSPPVQAPVDREPRVQKNTPSSASGNNSKVDSSLFDGLDRLDLSEADDLFNPEQVAAALAGDEDKISFDDALLQGIIGNIDE